MSKAQQKYKNTGAHWQREDGTVIGGGAIFVPTPMELLMFSYKLKPATEEEVAASVVAVEEAKPLWPMSMQPDLYLRLHPTGEHAELARRLVAEKETK